MGPLQISNTQGPSTSDSGRVTVGGFTFAPKSSTLPVAAWIALAVVGVVVALKFLKR